jgi:undecaprenyl diphosphate synthase
MNFVEARNLPGHIGIIMDGNGRWAQLRGQPRAQGHREGATAVRRTVRAARRLGLHALTLYAFSEQNWARPEEEVDAVMQLLREFLLSERDEILDHGIRLNAVGNLGRLPAIVRAALDPLRRDSERNHEMTLTLALSYGGREEIAYAARAHPEPRRRRPRSHHSDRRRAAHLQLSPLRARVRRAAFRGRLVAGLRGEGPLRRDRQLSKARATVRSRRHTRGSERRARRGRDRRRPFGEGRAGPFPSGACPRRRLGGP